MIRTLLATCLLFAAPLFAEEQQKKNHPASAKLVFKLTQGDKLIAKAALHTDLRGDDYDEMDGSTTLALPNGERWRVDMHTYLGGEDEDERRLHIEIRDIDALQESVEDGDSSTVAVLLFEANRIWNGPGNYPLADQGEMTISVDVEISQPEGKKPAEPAPEKP